MPERTVRAFIASPGDLAAERRAFKEQIEQLNVGFGDGADVRFVAVGWEDTLASTGRRVQSVINQEIDTCDVFVLALHRRWGQKAPDSSYSSYTEEEFFRALQRFKQTGLPEIFVFFKSVDEASLADPGPELAKVIRFRIELEHTRSVRYRTFADAAAFRRDIDSHLRAFAKGLLPTIAVEPDRLPLPLDLVNRVEQVEAEAKARADAAESREKEQRSAAQAAIEKANAYEARAEALASLVTTQAAAAAREGRIVEARSMFANATVGNANPQVLDLAFEFYWRAGPLEAAQDMLERRLATVGPEAEAPETATVLSNLGLIHQMRGDLRRAEELHAKALALDDKVAHAEGMARDYRNLGLIHLQSRRLQEAEEMHRKALDLHTQLKHAEGISGDFTCLGLVHQARGDAGSAEQMHRQALIAAASTGYPAPAGIVTIPIVVHVVYKLAAENIGDAQVQGQIGALNKDFRARNVEIADVPAAFKPLIGDACIEFELATRDPEGRQTSGITRTRTTRKSFDTNSPNNVQSREKGGSDAWPADRYLNLWVCSLSGGVLSASLSQPAASESPDGMGKADGIMIANTAFGTVGSAMAPFNRGRSATSAIATYLGLRHIWEKENVRPGSHVADTPPQEGPNLGTPTFPHISSNNGPHGDMFMNFMDYCDDEALSMFTKGQVLRMHAVLHARRKGLGRWRDAVAAATVGNPPRGGAAAGRPRRPRR